MSILTTYMNNFNLCSLNLDSLFCGHNIQELFTFKDTRRKCGIKPWGQDKHYSYTELNLLQNDLSLKYLTKKVS